MFALEQSNLLGDFILSRFPETRISLILRLAAAEDVEAWREFAAIYAPAVYAIARRRGLQAADAEDFVQELLLAVARAAGRWKPDNGRARFRTWLYRVATNLLADHFQQRCAARNLHESLSAAGEVETQSEQVVLASEFELEYRRALFHRAATIVRQRVSEITWEAFAATAIDAVPAAAVSARLGIPIGSVYVARSRAMKLLRQEIERIQLSEERKAASELYTTRAARASGHLD